MKVFRRSSYLKASSKKFAKNGEEGESGNGEKMEKGVQKKKNTFLWGQFTKQHKYNKGILGKRKRRGYWPEKGVFKGGWKVKKSKKNFPCWEGREKESTDNVTTSPPKRAKILHRTIFYDRKNG